MYRRKQARPRRSRTEIHPKEDSKIANANQERSKYHIREAYDDPAAPIETPQAIEPSREIMGLPLNLPAYCSRIAETLEDAHALGEVKNIPDRIAAIETFTKQAKDHNGEALLANLRYDAGRKAGQLLRTMPKAKGTRYSKARANGGHHTLPPQETLKSFHISKRQSVLWQDWANIPDDQWQEIKAAAFAVGKVPSATRIATAVKKRSTDAAIENIAAAAGATLQRTPTKPTKTSAEAVRTNVGIIRKAVRNVRLAAAPLNIEILDGLNTTMLLSLWNEFWEPSAYCQFWREVYERINHKKTHDIKPMISQREKMSKEEFSIIRKLVRSIENSDDKLISERDEYIAAAEAWAVQYATELFDTMKKPL